MTRPSLVQTFRSRPLTCLGDAVEVVGGGRSAFAQDVLARHFPYAYLRKVWEWDYIADCAERLDLLDGRRAAIGLGVGNEPLIFHFANHCAQVVATDLYSTSTDWPDARTASTAEVIAASPIPFPQDRLEIRNADMRALGQADASMDFAWSTSSLEHVPTLRDVTRVLDELARVLKDGGVGILTTEFCITEGPFHLPGVNAWDPVFFAAIKVAMDGVFEFVGAEDLDFNWAYPGNWMSPRQVRRKGVNQRLRNVLQPLFQAGPMQFPAGVSSLAPIAFVLKRKPRRSGLFGRAPAAGTIWERLHPAPGVADYTAGIEAIQDGRPQEARVELEKVVRTAHLPLQQRLHAFRYYAEAGVLSGLDMAVLAREAALFCRDLPQGEFQDADVLHYLGHIILAAGDGAEALRLFGLALGSPSTTLDHALNLAGDYLAAGNACGELSAAMSEAAEAIVDIIVSGAPPGRIESGVRSAGIAAKLGDKQAAAFNAEVNGRLAAEGLPPLPFSF